MTYNEAVAQVKMREALHPVLETPSQGDEDPDIIAKALTLLDDARKVMNEILNNRKPLRSSDYAELIRQEFFISQFLHAWGIEEEVM